ACGRRRNRAGHGNWHQHLAVPSAHRTHPVELTSPDNLALCCSFADGFVVSDVDWESKDGHYRVRLEGRWIDVPDDAVITEPNRAGRTMVWPYVRGTYPPRTEIRCFMPGSMG